MILSLDEHSSARVFYESPSKRWWTYNDLRDSVKELLRAFVVSPKPLVFNFCRNDIRSIVTYLASLEAGNAVALLDDGLRADAKANLIDLYQPEFISTAQELPYSGYELVRESLWRR